MVKKRFMGSKWKKSSAIQAGHCFQTEVCSALQCRWSETRLSASVWWSVHDRTTHWPDPTPLTQQSYLHVSWLKINSLFDVGMIDRSVDIRAQCVSEFPLQQAVSVDLFWTWLCPQVRALCSDSCKFSESLSWWETTNHCQAAITRIMKV